TRSQIASGIWRFTSFKKREGFASLGDHYIRRFDYSERVVAGLEGKFVYRFIGDRRGDDHPTSNVDADVGCCLTLGHTDDLALDLIAGAELHPASLRYQRQRQRRSLIGRSPRRAPDLSYGT